MRSAGMFPSASFSTSTWSATRPEELLVGIAPEPDVPAHREIGAVELQHEPRLHDRFVLGLHRFRDRLEVLSCVG